MVELSELQFLIDTEHDIDVPWIEPSLVKGYDRTLAFELAKKAWFSPGGVDLTDSAVELVPDYLDSVLLQVEDAASGEQLLDAVIWMVQNLGSCYAVHTLCVWREMLSDTPLEVAVQKVLTAIAAAREPFVRDLLRDIFWEFLKLGELWKGWEERVATLPEEVQVRLRVQLEHPYETIVRPGRMKDPSG